MLAQAEVSPAAVIRTFANDSPYLFLGSVFVGVGLIAAGFTALRRKFDPLFIYFALFAVLYGFRMWVQADLTAFALSHWWFYPRLHDAINYLIPLPAFVFFGSAGLLNRSGPLVGYAVAFMGAGRSAGVPRTPWDWSIMSSSLPRCWCWFRTFSCEGECGIPTLSSSVPGS